MEGLSLSSFLTLLPHAFSRITGCGNSFQWPSSGLPVPFVFVVISAIAHDLLNLLFNPQEVNILPKYREMRKTEALRHPAVSGRARLEPRSEDLVSA